MESRSVPVVTKRYLLESDRFETWLWSRIWKKFRFDTVQHQSESSTPAKSEPCSLVTHPGTPGFPLLKFHAGGKVHNPILCKKASSSGMAVRHIPRRILQFPWLINFYQFVLSIFTREILSAYNTSRRACTFATLAPISL